MTSKQRACRSQPHSAGAGSRCLQALASAKATLQASIRRHHHARNQQAMISLPGCCPACSEKLGILAVESVVRVVVDKPGGSSIDAQVKSVVGTSGFAV